MLQYHYVALLGRPTVCVLLVGAWSAQLSADLDAGAHTQNQA
jgi:hypothetical protein